MRRNRRVLSTGRELARPHTAPACAQVRVNGNSGSTRALSAALALVLGLVGCQGYEVAALDARLCLVGFSAEQGSAVEAAVQAWNDTGATELTVSAEQTRGCIPIYAQKGPNNMAASWGDIGHSVSGMTAPDASRIDLLVDSAWTDEDHELQSVAMHELCHLLSGPAHIQDESDLMFTHQNNVTVLSDYDIGRVVNR